ncbi:MAG: hypothetical protein ACKOYM_11130 [Actinomycetes bacterium]
MTARMSRRVTGRGASEVELPMMAGGVACIAVLLVGVSLSIDLFNLDVWTGLLTGLILLTISLPVFMWMAKRDDWPRLVVWLSVALALKFVFSMIRYFVIFRVYKGEGDAGIYVEAGAELAKRIRLGLPLHPLDHRINSYPVESQYMGDITGIVFYLTGASKYATFLIYSWVCFIGQLFAAQALKIAVPEANYRRYTLVLVFLPSLLFWPSSAGKEAVMTFALGIMFWGAAYLLGPTPKAIGLVPFLSGAGIAMLFRPHIAIMGIAALGAAFGFSFVLGNASKARQMGSKFFSRVARGLGLVVMIAVFVLSSSQLGRLMGEEPGSDGGLSATAALEKAAKQSTIGNSAFTPPMVSNPVMVPWGVASVLFRPFPWEASGGSLIAAAESALLGGLFVLSAGRLLTLWTMVRRRAYVVFSMAFVVEFAIGFSYIGNFGILARQRVLMLPAVLLMLALPTREELAEYDASQMGEELPSNVATRRLVGTLTTVGAPDYDETTKR